MSAASRLRTRVTLQSPTRISDDLGGAALGWANEGEAWAEIVAQGGARAPALDGEAVRMRWRITLRAPSPVESGWRVVWGGRVVRVRTVAPRDALIELDCEEETL